MIAAEEIAEYRGHYKFVRERSKYMMKWRNDPAHPERRVAAATAQKKFRKSKSYDPLKEEVQKRIKLDSDPRGHLLRTARKRAEQQQVPFSITKADLPLLNRCPVCDVEMRRGRGKMQSASPSIDKIVPQKGYIPGNVTMMCLRCNTKKNNMTLAELRRFVAFLEQWPTI